MRPSAEAVPSPIIFLLGPPGAGNSALSRRACTEFLVGLPFDEAADAVRDCIAEIRVQSDNSPAEREGRDRWVDD